MGGTRLLNPKMDPYSTTSNQKNVTAECNFSFRKPVSTDGSDVFALVERCKPLDVNSMYCNLLQCSHFADAVADPPWRPGTAFSHHHHAGQSGVVENLSAP